MCNVIAMCYLTRNIELVLTASQIREIKQIDYKRAVIITASQEVKYLTTNPEFFRSSEIPSVIAEGLTMS